MATSVTSFRIGLAAFIVPFMFFYNPALLGDGTWYEITRAVITAGIGVCLLSAAVQGWFFTGRMGILSRVTIGIAALFLIEGGLLTDLAGAGLTLGAVLISKFLEKSGPAPKPVE